MSIRFEVRPAGEIVPLPENRIRPGCETRPIFAGADAVR